MSRPLKRTPYDSFMLESFQMGRNHSQVYTAINRQQLEMKKKPVLSRKSVYNRYIQWIKDGKPGELVSEKIRTEDGTIIVIWKEKKKG